MSDATEWLRANRCPWCVKHDRKACEFKVVKAYDGWRCYGYRSRAWDERAWK